jgi:hypothetical protein
MKRRLITFGGLITLTLASACSPPPAEKPGAVAAEEVGVCWRVRTNPGQARVREVLERDIDNLQTCATRLEAVRMMGAPEVEGAFEGRSIYVTEAEITQGRPKSRERYPVFTDGQRREVQEAIRRLLENRAPEAA